MSYNPVPKLTNGNATFNNDVNVSGLSTAGSGVLLVDLVPASTTNKLYNDAGTLKFNGSAIGGAGGGSGLPYSSGDYYLQEIRANSASGVAISGISVYGSGHNLQTVTDNGASTTNAVIITNNNITASSGLFDSLDMTPLGNGSQPAYQEGVVFYDSENHTLSLYNDEADVTLQLGQEEFLRVRNNTGATIPNGAAVLINGAHGNAAPTISGAIATSEASSQAVGLATHDIEDSSFGYVTTYGIVRDVDTSAFSAGDEIFLSATQIGSGVAVAPVIPNYKISLGHVIRSHSNGSILVQVGNPKLGGGDLKSEAPLNMSGVPFVTSISDTTAGGSQTDPLFVYDSGNNQLQLASLLIEPNGATKIGEVIKGAVSQSANLQEWQNSSENTLAHVDSSGVYTNIIGTSGTDILRIKYGDPLHDNDGSSGADVTGVWLDYEDGSEYATPINNNALIIGTWYNTAKTSTSRIRISSTSFNLKLANSSKIDCQGSTTKFNTNVQPWSSSSTWDLGQPTVPWTNVYASDTVYASGLSASGVELTNHVPADTTNRLYNDAGTLKFNGSAVGGGSSYTAGSGLTLVGTEFNVYGGSGNFEHLELTTDNNIVPKLKFLGSGIHDTPINLEVRSSFQGASGSGTALLFQGTQGQLFSVTDNLSSGVIFNVSDITGLPLIEVDASGDIKLGEFGRYVGIGSGIPEYGFDVSSSGRIQKGVVLSNYVPATTTNTLYNDGGTLKFNGSTIGGGVVSAVANGSDNRVATFSSSDALNGEANLTFDGSTLAVNGAFTATTKSFLIDHPTKEGMKLQYASLEGPENGVYIRGTNGCNIITLPDYWSKLVDQSTVTVSLTPIGYYQALYVEEKGKNYIKVGGSKGSYDYVVYGERKDVEKLKVEW